MRSLAFVLISGVSLIAGTPLLAADDSSVFVDGGQLQVAHEENKDEDHEHDQDERLTREELRERKRELREQERELRERERRQEAKKRLAPRMWVGVGAGVAYASAEVPCDPGSFGSDCTAEGRVSTYSANVTFSGPHTAFRIRGVRDADKGGDERTPYETAVLIGNRFGRSNWYGLVGAGRIRHADDRFEGNAHGFAWEILFAPSSSGASGLELSFQGNLGHEVEYVGFNLGFRLGALR